MCRVLLRALGRWRPSSLRILAENPEKPQGRSAQASPGSSACQAPGDMGAHLMVGEGGSALRLCRPLRAPGGTCREGAWHVCCHWPQPLAQAERASKLGRAGARSSSLACSASRGLTPSPGSERSCLLSPSPRPPLSLRGPAAAPQHTSARRGPGGQHTPRRQLGELQTRQWGPLPGGSGGGRGSSASVQRPCIPGSTFRSGFPTDARL